MASNTITHERNIDSKANAGCRTTHPGRRHSLLEPSWRLTLTNASPRSLVAAATNDSVVRLPEVVVEGRQDSLLGIADSAAQGTTGAAQLSDRPILRSGEILETIPGVIITQHAGGGKANQYFLRGFNLDHGTDFAVSSMTCRSTCRRTRTARVTLT